MMKAWYGDAATKENDFCYDYLPKRRADRNYTHIGLFEAMYDGIIKGFLVFGSNPFVSGPDANKETKALENLDWMVAADLFETETASFWKKEAGADPEKIKTEVFFLPAAAHRRQERHQQGAGSVSAGRRDRLATMSDLDL